jgi:hypothetical protein
MRSILNQKILITGNKQESLPRMKETGQGKYPSCNYQCLTTKN